MVNAKPGTQEKEKRIARGRRSSPCRFLRGAVDHSASSLSDLAAPSDQRERTIEETPAAGPHAFRFLVYRGMIAGAHANGDDDHAYAEWNRSDRPHARHPDR